MKFKLNKKLTKDIGVNVFSSKYNGFPVSYWFKNNSWGIAVGQIFNSKKNSKDEAINSAIEFIDRHIM